MTDENIICFAKDWEEEPTSNNHVMRSLARNNRVLWLNSISMRTPSLSSGRDVRKIVAKVRRSLRGPRRVTESLWTYTPLVLPLPHSRTAMSVNRWIVRCTIGALRRRLGMKEFQLWSFLPNVADYVDCLNPSLVVYYCVDEFSGFGYVDGPRIAEAERGLCARADIVFVASQRLLDSKLPLNAETHLSTHGVDHAHFARALDPSTLIPPDIAELPHPILGFYGTIRDWVDLPLIAEMAQRRPEWTFVLIGKVFADTSRVVSLPNVRFLGPRPHSDLPAYCKSFDVGLIPYVLNDRMQYVNPIKLREYLSAGLPVVSTDVPEVRRTGELCAIAHSAQEFEICIDRALQTDNPKERARRSETMQHETWDARVEVIGEQIARLKRLGCKRAVELARA